MSFNVKIIADTYGQRAVRITTFEVCAPRFLLAEVNTHRVISKSAASSRAIPVAKRIKMIQENPFIPAAFGKNKPGMQSDEVLDDGAAALARQAWLRAANNAVFEAQELERQQVHKQFANRILEPFAHYDGVMTATEWDNFFKLRTHKDAQPEFKELADAMLEAYNASTPQRSYFGWHLPYVTDEEKNGKLLSLDDLKSISSARCARVSYKTFDGKLSTAEADIKLCNDLLSAGHMSPFDHPARADEIDNIGTDGMSMGYWRHPEDHRQYFGWIPHRVDIERATGYVGRRDSYAPF